MYDVIMMLTMVHAMDRGGPRGASSATMQVEIAVLPRYGRTAVQGPASGSASDRP